MDTTLADQAFDLRNRLEIWANDYYFLPDPKDRATELPPSLKDAFSPLSAASVWLSWKMKTISSATSFSRWEKNWT